MSYGAEMKGRGVSFLKRWIQPNLRSGTIPGTDEVSHKSDMHIDMNALARTHVYPHILDAHIRYAHAHIKQEPPRKMPVIFYPVDPLNKPQTLLDRVIS